MKRMFSLCLTIILCTLLFSACTGHTPDSTEPTVPEPTTSLDTEAPPQTTAEPITPPISYAPSPIPSDIFQKAVYAPCYAPEQDEEFEAALSAATSGSITMDSGLSQYDDNEILAVEVYAYQYEKKYANDDWCYPLLVSIVSAHFMKLEIETFESSHTVIAVTKKELDTIECPKNWKLGFRLAEKSVISTPKNQVSGQEYLSQLADADSVTVFIQAHLPYHDHMRANALDLYAGNDAERMNHLSAMRTAAWKDFLSRHSLEQAAKEQNADLSSPIITFTLEKQKVMEIIEAGDFDMLNVITEDEPIATPT